MTHIAIAETLEGEAVTRLEPVSALSGLHGAQSGALRTIAAGRTSTPSHFILHIALPIALAALIAILATAKPF